MPGLQSARHRFDARRLACRPADIDVVHGSPIRRSTSSSSSRNAPHT
jgi:hypothetical protein